MSKKNEIRLVSINDPHPADAESGFECLGRPNFSALLALGQKPKRILAVSAYCDPESINQLINYMTKHGAKSPDLELVILLDRGARRIDEVKELDERIERNKNRNKNKKFNWRSGIYLAHFGELFHSKGYLVESRNEGKCAIGSLNLTQKGLTKNAELLAVYDYKIVSRSPISKFAKSFKNFVYQSANIKKRKDDNKKYRVSEINKEDLKIRHKTMREFFLDGKLYYEAKEIGPFCFKLHLPDEILKSPSGIIPNQKSQTPDILDMREEINLGIEDDENKEKSLWKRYCFPTCYGYWAPDCHHEKIHDQLKKNKSREEGYKKTFNKLETRKEEIWCALLEKCQIIYGNIISREKSENLYSKHRKSWQFSSSEIDGLDEEFLRKKYEDWFKKLNRSNKKEFISRLCGNVQFTKMPDIWEDEEAVEDFEGSFKQSFNYLSSKSGSKNELLRLLKDNSSNGSPLRRIHDWLTKN